MTLTAVRVEALPLGLLLVVLTLARIIKSVVTGQGTCCGNDTYKVGHRRYEDWLVRRKLPSRDITVRDALWGPETYDRLSSSTVGERSDKHERYSSTCLV